MTFFITPFHYTDCFSVRQIGYGGIIDTLQKVRETCTDNTYARDYADLARLKELADRCRTTVLLVHHLRKQYDSDPLNRVSGEQRA